MHSSDLQTIDAEVQTSLYSFETEVKKLREDKEILEGKIRGYLTLSEICHEYKEENRKLQAEYTKLLQKEKMKPKDLSSESPAPNNDNLESDNGPDLEQRTTQPKDPNHTALPMSGIATELVRDRKIKTSDLFDPGPTNTSASKGDDFVNQPRTSEFTGTSWKDRDHSHTSQEKFPMQESLATESLRTNQTNRSLTGLGFQQSSSGEMVLGQSATNFILSDKDLMNFSYAPSLNAKQLTKTPGREIEMVLRSIPKDMEDPSTGEKVASVVKDVISNLNQKIDKLRKGNAILIDQNTDLKKKLELTGKDFQLVLLRVRKLEQEKYDISRSQSPDELQASGWVKVEKVSKGETQQTAEIPEEEARRVAQIQLHPNEKIDDINWLQTHYRQIRDSNIRWSEEWDKLKTHYDERLNAVQQERDRLEKALTERKIEEEASRRDIERAISQLKEKANEEEKSKEEALLQLTTSNNRLEQMQKQISELSDKVMVLKREKQAKDSEIQVLRQGISPAMSDERQKSHGRKSHQELQTEIDVLRQQLLVFQEDFDRERQDRATAQSLKDDYKKQNESLKKRVRHLEHKLAIQESKVTQAEETSRRTLTENERLQQELTDLKNKYRRELEQNRMMLNFAPQQPPIMQSAGLHHLGQPMYGGAQMPPQYMPPVQGQYTPQQFPQFAAGGNYMMGSGSQTPARPTGAQYTQRNQPLNGRAMEHLPGSWPCNQCTYMNYPGRTVCEMCGYIQSPTTQNNFRLPGNGSDILMPRGDENQRQMSPYPQYNYQNPGQNIGPNQGNRAV